MNTKLLSISTIAGIGILAALCVYQWRNEFLLNGKIREKNTEIAVLTSSLAEREKAMQGLAGDSAFFKEKFEAAKIETDDLRERLKKTGAENAALALRSGEREADEKIFEDALRGRDEALEEANERLKKLSGEVEAAVARFNELAGKYNGVVEDLDDAHRELAQAYEDLNATRRQLYKALGKPLPEGAPAKAGGY